MSGKKAAQMWQRKPNDPTIKNPLRTLSEEDRKWFERISRSLSEPAAHVALVKEILAIVDGYTYSEAAQIAGMKTGASVSHLVERFN
jgi:DNA-directed RNA polymerase specialized sigma24 family protein